MDEWMLKINKNQVKYIIDINNFNKKIRNFKFGRKIYSKEFKISNTIFRIEVFPTNDKEYCKNYVSIYLVNRSNWRVKLNATFSVQAEAENINRVPEFINSNVFLQDIDSRRDNETGIPDFIEHERCKIEDLLNANNGLTIQIDVELLEEEVLASQDLTKNETKEKLTEIADSVIDTRDKVEDVYELIGIQTDRIEALHTTVGRQTGGLQQTQIQVEEMKSEIREIRSMFTTLLSRVGGGKAAWPGWSMSTQRQQFPQCPVCLEPARPPMRLKQCGQVLIK